jgi:hypothetical protein
MKQFILITCLSVALMSCGGNEDKTTTTSTTDSLANSNADTSMSTSAPETPVDSATMMKNWQAYATPGSMHQMMSKWDGTWTGKVIMWHAPGAPADSSDGTAINKMLYGGRYQQSTHKGNMMGMAFEGTSIMGYDNAKKVFQSTWYDNMGTGMMIMEGPWDEASKSITMSGKMVDPSAGTAKEITMRHVMKVIDDNNHIFEMYCNGPDGKEFKTMEINLKRK